MAYEEFQAELRARLGAAGVGCADALAALVRPSVRFESDPGTDEAAVAVGAHRIGGRPDLPPGTPWPRLATGAPLAFVAQVDLAAVAEHDLERLLPPDGLLSFFADDEDQPWGYDPADAGRWAVLHTPGDAPLVRTDFPADLAAEHRFAARALVAHPEPSIPRHDAYDARRAGLAGDWLAYSEATEQYRDVPTAARLLGYPDTFQGDVQLQAQLVSNGVYRGGDQPPDPRIPELTPGAAEWRLLFQVDSDDDIGLMWALTGQVYYLIRDRDLRARRWDATWFCLECS